MKPACPDSPPELDLRATAKGFVSTLARLRDAPTDQGICTGQVTAIINNTLERLPDEPDLLKFIAEEISAAYPEFEEKAQVIFCQNLSVFFCLLKDNTSDLMRFLSQNLQVKIAVLNAISGNLGMFSQAGPQPLRLSAIDETPIQRRIGEAIKRAERLADQTVTQQP